MFFLVLCVFSRKKTVEDEIKELDFSNVIFLDDSNFEQVTKADKGTIEDWAVFFFDPTCPYCRKLIISWVKIANLLANSTDLLKPKLAAIDCV